MSSHACGDMPVRSLIVVEGSQSHGVFRSRHYCPRREASEDIVCGLLLQLFILRWTVVCDGSDLGLQIFPQLVVLLRFRRYGNLRHSVSEHHLLCVLRDY